MNRIGIDLRMLGKSCGGIGRYVFELTRHLLEIDSQNKYFLFYNQKLAEPQDLLQFEGRSNVVLVPTAIRHYSLGEQTRFLRLLNRHNLDLVHFPNFNVPVFYKKPFVVTIHDMVHHKIGGAKKSHLVHFLAYKYVMKKAVSNSRRIITVSEASKQDILKYFPFATNKVRVIYEGTSQDALIGDKEVAEVKEKFLLNKPYFLFVGVLERKKNIVNLTRGFDQFLKKFKMDVDLVIVGKVDPHYPTIKFKAMEITHKDHLVFTGAVSDRDLLCLYKGALAFVSASLHEGFGLPGVEAMRFGLPLAVSNIGVFNEIYDNAAVYFDPLDPKDLAEKLHLLVRDNLFYEQLQRHSFSRGQLFSWHKTAQQTFSIYQEVLSVD